MAIEDYIPNIFGGAPTGYEGLLGADQSAALQKRANLGGLLGAVGALAQGMSPQGYRRSPLQNVLTALGAGFAGAGQTYESGLKNIISQQQLALQQRQVAGIQAMKQKYPDLADEFDTNPAGAFRLVAEREALTRKPISLKEGEMLVSPKGEVIFSGAQKPKAEILTPEQATALGLPAGGVYQRKATGEVELVTGTAPKAQGKILTSEEAQQFGLPSGVIYQQTASGEIKPVEGTGAKAPEVRDFNDGTTRQYDTATQTWKVLARKPSGEEKSMYAGEPTVDSNGRLVFLPKRPGLPVVDAQTGRPVDYVPKGKPLPSLLQKSEEEDFDLGRSAANLATDANKYVNSILTGNIKFGLKEKARIAALSAVGSDDPDVVNRNDFDRWKTEYINESLRQNKGTQTEGDAVRAGKELSSAESKADAAKAILRLREINARRVNDYNARISERRKNAGAGEPEVKLDVPKFEPVVITPSDYAKIPNGVTYIDVNGVRRVKGKRQ
jgi:hypothetical protein